MRPSASILVVDDELVLRDNVRQLLEETGYRVLTATDGVEALAVMKAQPVDLVVTDIAMPRMNGYELYARIRENPAWATIPCVSLSARALDSDIRYGKQLGVDDYLVKPFQLEDLLAAVEGKLRRARQLACAPQPAQPSLALGQRAVTVGRLQIDPGQHRAWFDQRLIHLSAREFTLLEYLARQPGIVIPPSGLVKVTHQLDTDDVEAGALLRPLIRSIRRKLGYPTGETGCVENVRGVGYRLIVPDGVL